MWVSNPNEELWTGSEDDLRAAQSLADKINAVDPKAFLGDSEAKAPSLLQKQGNVGVIQVHGQLFSSVPDWAKAIFGVSDYNDLSQALVDAARDPEIGAILLDIDSPGGAVNGIDGPANLVSRIDSDLKPVVAAVGGQMASAAYWIGSGARAIHAGPLSMVGSIGVLLAHTERSKAQEMDGVKTTVLRAGKYKALGNPYEPLSDEARAEIQSKLDYTYKMFMGHVAENRGVSYEAGDAVMGQGRTFIGDTAKAAGLVDAIVPYEQSFAYAQELASKSVDARKSLIQNPKKQKEGSAMKGKKATLTEAQLAALASGATIEPEALAEDPALAAEAPAADPVAGEVAAPEAVEPAAVAPVAPVADPAVVALLQSQLSSAQETLLASRVDLAKATDEVTGLRAAQDPLLQIARGAVQKMCIALGSSGDHVATLSGQALVDEHRKVAEIFTTRFKVGGVAAASAQVEPVVSKAPASSADQARLKAVRLASK